MAARLSYAKKLTRPDTIGKHKSDATAASLGNSRGTADVFIQRCKAATLMRARRSQPLLPAVAKRPFRPKDESC